ELVTLERSLQPALAELPATIAATRSTMEASHTLLRHLNDLAVSARAPLASVTAAARSVQDLSAAGLNSIQTLNYQTLPELNRLSSQLAQSSQRLGRLSENLEDAPQSLVFGRTPPPPGPGQPGFVSSGRP
ncbi:MAG: MlaD family protein, partial [Acidithiobacillus sp.]